MKKIHEKEVHKMIEGYVKQNINIVKITIFRDLKKFKYKKGFCYYITEDEMIKLKQKWGLT